MGESSTCPHWLARGRPGGESSLRLIPFLDYQTALLAGDAQRRRSAFTKCKAMLLMALVVIIILRILSDEGFMRIKIGRVDSRPFFSREEAARKAKYIAARLREMKLATAAKTLENGYLETLSYYAFPTEHHRSIQTNNPLERINREIRRRTRVVGAFPDRYLDMDRLNEAELKAG